jgi:hypothetical protein
MVSSEMLRRVALVRTDVSEELSASIRVTRIGELGTALAVTSNRRTRVVVIQLIVSAYALPSTLIISTLIMAAIRFSETSALTRATRRHIPEDDILYSHRCEHLKSWL